MSHVGVLPSRVAVTRPRNESAERGGLKLGHTHDIRFRDLFVMGLSSSPAVSTSVADFAKLLAQGKRAAIPS